MRPKAFRQHKCASEIHFSTHKPHGLFADTLLLRPHFDRHGSVWCAGQSRKDCRQKQASQQLRKLPRAPLATDKCPSQTCSTPRPGMGTTQSHICWVCHTSYITADVAPCFRIAIVSLEIRSSTYLKGCALIPRLR